MPDDIILIGPVRAGKSTQGRLLAEHRGGVVDFGAGHSVQEDPALFERVRQALAPYPNVVLLLPSPDAEESIRVSKERKGDRTRYVNDFDVLYVTHPSNRALAKHVVYTEGKAPEETRDEVLERLGLTP